MSHSCCNSRNICKWQVCPAVKHFDFVKKWLILIFPIPTAVLGGIPSLEKLIRRGAFSFVVADKHGHLGGSAWHVSFDDFPQLRPHELGKRTYRSPLSTSSISVLSLSQTDSKIWNIQQNSAPTHSTLPKLTCSCTSISSSLAKAWTLASDVFGANLPGPLFDISETQEGSACSL